MLDLKESHQTLLHHSKVLSNKQSIVTFTFLRSFLSSLSTFSLNVNAILAIFCHDLSKMFFSTIFPLSLTLLSIHTNRRVHLLASHIKDTEMSIWFICGNSKIRFFLVSVGIRPKTSESLNQTKQYTNWVKNN